LSEEEKEKLPKSSEETVDKVFAVWIFCVVVIVTYKAYTHL
jgi:hypothetical protein